jgi:hypothetical protein
MKRKPVILVSLLLAAFVINLDSVWRAWRAG